MFRYHAAKHARQQLLLCACRIYAYIYINGPPNCDGPPLQAGHPAMADLCCVSLSQHVLCAHVSLWAQDLPDLSPDGGGGGSQLGALTC